MHFSIAQLLLAVLHVFLLFLLLHRLDPITQVSEHSEELIDEMEEKVMDSEQEKLVENSKQSVQETLQQCIPSEKQDDREVR